MPEISVQIVTFNSAQTISNCLGSVYRSAPKENLEILIWDNASGDNTKAIISQKFPGVKIFHSVENLGFGTSHNQLLEQAKGDFILILNPDAYLKNGCLTQLSKFLQNHPQIGAVGPKLVYPGGRFQISWGNFPSFFQEFETKRDWKKARSATPRDLAYLEKKYLREGYVDWLSGACLLVRRKALEKVGGFDPNFFLYYEDSELCLRLAKAGFRCYYFPAAETEHSLAQSTEKTPWTKEFRSRQSQLYYYWKWKSVSELKLVKLYLNLKFSWLKLKLNFTGGMSPEAETFFAELFPLLRQEKYPSEKDYQKPARRKTSFLSYLLDYLGRWVYELFAPLFSTPDRSDFIPQKILFIKLCCLGDVLFTTPTVRAFRKKFPQAALVYLTGSWCETIVSWNPHIDRVLVFDAPFNYQSIYRKSKETWRLIRKLREEKFDLIVSFHRDYRAALLAWLSGAKLRVGFNQSGANYLFTRRIDFSENLHEVKRYLKLAEICGAKSDDYHLEAVKERSQKPQTNFSDSLTVCIAPGGGKNPGTFMPIKRWPYYPELAKRLRLEMECQIILVGDKFDMEAGEKIERENPGTAINLIGKTDFSELANIIQQSSLFIGNDSGVLYLAAALGVPTVGIYGPSDPDLVAPPGESHISIKGSLYCSPCYRPDTVYGQSYFDCWTKTLDCLKKLSVEKVMQAVKRQLEKISLTQA
ncbi:MAG: hypothetical protein A2142_09160 [candidate division Zixibacteria bacterium RBG_16_48_11]|nr:MAG: hypothetical protein A2142_09160 [candidate division Zixibacteria bacterium RBG_16_48_11]